MRRIWIGVLSIVLVSTIACQCPAARQATLEVERTNNLIAPKFLEYIEADQKLKPGEKEDWKGLVESNKTNIQALKDAFKE